MGFSDHGFALGVCLDPSLFALTTNELTVHIQEEVPWCLLFADNIMFVDELRDNVNTKH